MKDTLQSTLRKLRLSGLAQTLDVRLQEALGHNLNHLEFLELILQDELFVRDERQINRRVKSAAFRELKTKSPTEFVVPMRTAMLWRFGEAMACYRDGNLRGAGLHLRWMARETR